MNRLPDGGAHESAAAAAAVYYLSSLPTVFDNPNNYEQFYSNSRMTAMIQDMYLPGEGDVIHVNNYENGVMNNRR